MDQQNWLTERFEENRPRLRAVAYRMLGSLSEAEDAVQEAWLRLNRIDSATVENLGGGRGRRGPGDQRRLDVGEAVRRALARAAIRTAGAHQRIGRIDPRAGR
jgi:hypothetical protein